MNILDTIFQLGYLGIFIISFLAASFVPLGSEAFIAAMPRIGYDIPLIFVAATAGHFLGSLTNYYIGKKGGRYLLIQKLKFSTKSLDLVESWFQRWGPPILILSWLPIVGDPLAGVAGIFRMNLWTFSLWIILGKGLRNLIILGLADIFWQSI